MPTFTFAELPSRLGALRDLGAGERIDPFWDGVWRQGTSAIWSSIHDELAGAHLPGDTPHARRTRAWAKRLAAAQPQALDRLARRRHWEAQLRTLACLHSYRTLSAQQLAALTGIRNLAAGGLHGPLHDLFLLGLIDLGSLPSAVTGGGKAESARLYRPSRTRQFERLFEPHLSFEEWCSVTAGGPFMTNGQYDRHNLLTAELLLRAAEHTPVEHIAGEGLADLATLLYTAAGRPAPNTQRAADGVLVRQDGIRIAIEMTASIGAGFNEKVAGWARSLHEQRLADCGTVVVFVIAPRTGQEASRGAEGIVRTVKKHVSKLARLHPGPSWDRTAERMFVVEWEDWFPNARTASTGFLALEAQRPSGAEASNPWVAASMLSPATFPPLPQDSPARTATAALAGLRQSPGWLPAVAATPPPQLWRVAAASSGIGEAGRKQRNTRTGQPITYDGGARGSAAATRAPDRLLPTCRRASP